MTNEAQSNGGVVSLRELEKQERTLADLQERIAAWRVREGELTAAVAAAVANDQDAAALRKERAQVRAELEDASSIAPLLAERIAARRERWVVAEAEKRLAGIERAHGSLSQQLDEDEKRVQKAATAYKAAVDQLNERFGALAHLKAEAGVLADRFGLAIPTLAPVVVPAKRKGCGEAVDSVAGVKFADHAHISPAFEHNEHRLRRRR